MTRDDYKIKNTMTFEEYQERLVNSIIDNIFDDFENRTCENCINDYQCDIQDSLGLEDYSLNFGCTFFKEKESK